MFGWCVSWLIVFVVGVYFRYLLFVIKLNVLICIIFFCVLLLFLMIILVVKWDILFCLVILCCNLNYIFLILLIEVSFDVEFIFCVSLFMKLLWFGSLVEIIDVMNLLFELFVICCNILNSFLSEFIWFESVFVKLVSFILFFLNWVFKCLDLLSIVVCFVCVFLSICICLFWCVMNFCLCCLFLVFCCVLFCFNVFSNEFKFIGLVVRLLLVKLRLVVNMVIFVIFVNNFILNFLFSSVDW